MRPIKSPHTGAPVTRVTPYHAWYRETTGAILVGDGQRYIDHDRRVYSVVRIRTQYVLICTDRSVTGIRIRIDPVRGAIMRACIRLASTTTDESFPILQDSCFFCDS